MQHRSPNLQVVNPRPCAVCGLPTSLWCSRCRNAYYCSNEHLQSDWPTHRKVCQEVDQAATSTDARMVAPSTSSASTLQINALLFAPEEDRPRLVSVAFTPGFQRSKNGDLTGPVPVINPWFPRDTPQSIVLTKGVSGDTLRYPLELWFLPTALRDKKPTNRAVAHITAGAAAKPWYGSVLVLKFNGTRRSAYADAGPNDIPALSAYFLAYK
ncbi:hypothetical protein FISHEDRAFT_34435 [Fistulina hepatica ATCC 64428]|uniref:MYND-type domain-containing protein n=1 Tax=Fistulina hepatica ATCC 64428 TaxID=1128425 RepID=A0A0D7AMJ4_9AGAR|nr:hypothetical protein FISHEDRAFT_34435 [Fistulina hepatica ATCC 64428]